MSLDSDKVLAEESNSGLVQDVPRKYVPRQTRQNSLGFALSLIVTGSLISLKMTNNYSFKDFSFDCGLIINILGLTALWTDGYSPVKLVEDIGKLTIKSYNHIRNYLMDFKINPHKI